MNPTNFNPSERLTVGIELELQLIERRTFNLATESADFLRRLDAVPISGVMKPEITQGMFEINSSIHRNFFSLHDELCKMQRQLTGVAEHCGINIAGGGTHPFQRWHHQRIYPTERYAMVSDRYGFLAQRFTVFGQHIHIGCESGDQAMYLCHALARYLPHFIALSASSPFYQGVDTSFDCARLTVISSFPLSGTPPFLLEWSAFEHYFARMMQLGVVESMKDFYWDIRPKPEYGTVEIRVCDTPLTVGWAAVLAAYAQMLAAWLLDQQRTLSPDIYLAYAMNRFRASRYGYSAELIDPMLPGHTCNIRDDILATLEQLIPYARELKARDAHQALFQRVDNSHNDAVWLRKQRGQLGTFTDIVHVASERWMNELTFA